MEFIYLNRIYKTLKNDGNWLIGCKLDEIIKLEEFIGAPLPKAYREFLIIMGKKAGKLFMGSNYYYSEVFKLRQSALELLEFNKFTIPLPENAFVFLMHQGYQFLFFLLDDSENPIVYYYSEGNKQVEFNQIGNFVELLEEELKAMGLELIE
jgi:hypothetical protein